MYYVLDREEILDSSSQKASGSFKKEVLARMEQSSQIKSINTRWLWYAAAATLLIGITIGRFVITDQNNHKYMSSQDHQSLSQLIASEDWNKLEIVLSDKDEYNRYSTDTIPIHILLDKLFALQKMGVQSLPIARTSDSNNEGESTIIQNDPKIQISLSDFIRLLEQTKRQRSTITLEEVSFLLANI
jgi:hypothetical protein